MVNKENSRFICGPGPILDIAEQCDLLPRLREAKDILIAEFVWCIGSGTEIQLYFLSLEIERYFNIGYQEAKVYVNTLWKLFREELAPIYRLVNPTMAPIEVQWTFLDAAGCVAGPDYE
jgi:hypothetical protein